MLAIQSGIAKYYCLYTQGAVASQTSGVFLTHPVLAIGKISGSNAAILISTFIPYDLTLRFLAAFLLRGIDMKLR